MFGLIPAYGMLGLSWVLVRFTFYLPHSGGNQCPRLAKDALRKREYIPISIIRKSGTFPQNQTNKPYG